jgi:threonine/homoserine/homoserine lactone efflux protein
MFDPGHLLEFVVSVFVLVLVPGPNTMIILAQSLAGRRAGLATVVGVELGTMVHTMAAAVGVTAVLSTSTLAFDVVKFSGVVYLIVIALKTMFSRAPLVSTMQASRTSVAFRRALATSVLNPKTAVFFFAFLPQFVRPERGHVFLQFVVLGGIVSGVGLCIGSALALAAAVIASSLRAHSGFARWQPRLMGFALLAIAVRLAVTRRPTRH